jgi:hypothetical protein
MLAQKRVRDKHPPVANVAPDLRDIARRVLGEGKRSGKCVMYYSPLRADDANRSFAVYADGAKDFGTGEYFNLRAFMAIWRRRYTHDECRSPAVHPARPQRPPPAWQRARDESSAGLRAVSVERPARRENRAQSALAMRIYR